MRVALVKSVDDVFGPWASVPYGEPLAPLWPGKAARLTTTETLKADWYVVDETTESRYFDQVLGYHREIMRKHMTAFPGAVPFNDYDVVISAQPILEPPQGTDTLFAYFASEDWDRSIKGPEHYPGYDLLLDIYMDAPAELTALPQAVSFPVAHVGRTKDVKCKDDKVWIDWRCDPMIDGDALSGLDVAARGPMFEAPCPPYGIHTPPLWGDAFDYLDRLAACKYYLSFGRERGPGQAVAEAAGVGCVCVGDAEREYHKLVCHPDCLCRSMDEALDVLERLSESASMRKDVLAHQRAALEEHFYERPMRILRQAVVLKRGGGA